MELQFHDVAKRYGAKEALRGIDLTLTPGVYGLLGPNGAGKSTLMNILTGNLRPTRGHVTLDGQDTVSMGEAFRRRLGYCPQQQALYPGFTGEQFLYYMASLQGMSREDAKGRMDWALARLDLTEAAGRPIRGWSGGMKQRLLLAQALLHDPDILVLDEPAAGLDPEGRDTILSQIRNYHEQTGITVILVSHSMEDIARYANRVLVMSKAKVAMYDTVEKVFARAPELLELGLSVPQVTQVFLMLKAMGMEIDTDVYTVPYAVKTVLKAWNAKHPDKAVPLPQNHKTVQEGGAD